MPVMKNISEVGKSGWCQIKALLCAIPVALALLIPTESIADVFGEMPLHDLQIIFNAIIINKYTVLASV